MSGCGWINNNKENWVVGWSYEEEGKIDWFAHQNFSEEAEDAKKIIYKFSSGKDYSYSPQEKIKVWGEVKKYTIYNQELKKKLWEVLAEYGHFEPAEYLEHLEPVEHFDPSWPDKPSKPFKPFKPRKPLRPLGKPKENEEWKKYKEEMNEYQKEWDRYKKEMEKYNREMQKWNEKIAKHNREISKKLSWQSAEKVNNTTNFEQQNNKDKWKWREFWLGISAALVLFGLLFGLIKLFRKRK